MSTLSPSGLQDSGSSSPLPFADPAEDHASKAAPATTTSNGSSGTQVESSSAAGAARETNVILRQQHREQLDRIVARTTEVGELLSELSPYDVEQALAVTFAARSELAQTERQLVRLALQSGQSWARIGAALGMHTGRATNERFGNI
jgi:hypothetical protein